MDSNRNLGLAYEKLGNVAVATKFHERYAVMAYIVMVQVSMAKRSSANVAVATKFHER